MPKSNESNKIKVLSYDNRTDTAKCRSSSTIFMYRTRKLNLKLYGYGVRGIWPTTARLRVSSLSVMAVTIWLFVMIVWGISGSRSLVSGTVFEFVVFEESGKTSVTLGYASDIFNAFLGNVRWNIVYRVIYEEAKIYYRVWGVKRDEEGPRIKSSMQDPRFQCHIAKGEEVGGWGKRRLRITDRAGYTKKLNSHLVCVFRCRSNESYKLGASQGGRRRILHSYGLWCLLSIRNNCFCNGNRLCVGQHLLPL